MNKNTIYDWLFKSALGISAIALFMVGLVTHNDKLLFFGAIYMASVVLMAIVGGLTAKWAALVDLWKSGEIGRDILENRSAVAISAIAAVVGVVFILTPEPSPAVFVPVLLGLIVWCFRDMLKKAKAR